VDAECVDAVVTEVLAMPVNDGVLLGVSLTSGFPAF